MKEKDKVAYLFEEAVGFFNQGEYRSAISAWEEILKYDPGNTQAQHGIRVATERMGAGDAPPAADAAPPAAETPPAEAAVPAPPARQPAHPAEQGGSDFDLGGGDDLFGDDFGDPLEGGPPEAPPAPEGPPIVQPPMPGVTPPQAAQPPADDLGEPADDLQFPVEDLPSDPGPEPTAPPAQAAPAPPADEDLGERVPASDDLSAWGLPATEPTPPADPSTIPPTAPPGAPPAQVDSEPQIPQAQPPAPDQGGILDGLEDLGDPLGGTGEPEAPAAAPPSEPDEFGWGDAPAPTAAGGGGSEFDDLGGVGELEDLALPPDGGEDLPPPPTAEEEPGFADRPEAEAIGTDTAPPPVAPSGGIFEEEDDDLEDFEGIPLSPPPSPDEAEDIEDLGADDLEPSSETIPLAQPIPSAPTIPAPAPAKKGGILVLLALVVIVAVIGGGGWFVLKILTGDGPTPDGPPTGPTGPTAARPDQAAALACREAMVAWRQKNPNVLIEKGRRCLDEGANLPGVNQDDVAILSRAVPIMERLGERPVVYRRGYIEGVLKEFCQGRNWRESFLTIKELKDDHPQFADELDPFMAQIYRNLGVTLLESDNPRDAISYFEKGLELTPGDQDLADLLRFARVYRNRYTGSSDYQDYVLKLRMRREGCPE